MTMELGLGVVLVALYVSALAMVVLLGLELTPSRRINPPQLDSPSNRQTNARRGFTREDDVNGEGARPSSLIPYYHHKPDRIYLLQLRYAVEIANEETVRKYGPLPTGGLPVTDKRKLAGKLTKPSITIESHEEDEAMKLKQMAAAAVLAAGTVACHSADFAPEDAGQAGKSPAHSSSAMVESTSTSRASAKTSEARLGPEYEKKGSFADFRKKLLADGWQPVTNPNCGDLLGMDEFCDVIPETIWASGTGYYVLHYVKDGTPLSVTLYGEIEALKDPDERGELWVTGWEYTTGTDFIPEETDPTYNPAYRLPPGGSPITDKRKFTGKLIKPSITIESNEEDEAMKLKQMAAAAALAAGAAACNSPTPAAGLANAAAPSTVQVQDVGTASAGSSSATASTNDSSAHAKKPTLGPEYKKMTTSFVEFRKKLIADGWKPVVNPDCLEEMVGVDYKDDCSKDPGKISCRACSMVPEIFIYTSQGYLTTRYVKDGAPLYVGSYGDIRDLDEPGRYGLVVTTWGYRSLD